MKVKVNVTEERIMDITLPFFRKEISYVSNKYFAVLNEDTQVTIFINDYRKSVAIEKPNAMDGDIYLAYSKWEEIEESDFFGIHQKALESLSLSPQLSDLEKEIMQEMKDYDDLKDVL